MNHQLSCLSQTPFLSPFLPLWTTFEPPQEFIHVLWRLASYLQLARNRGRKESSYLVFWTSPTPTTHSLSLQTPHTMPVIMLKGAKQDRVTYCCHQVASWRNCNLLLIMFHNGPVVHGGPILQKLKINKQINDIRTVK